MFCRLRWKIHSGINFWCLLVRDALTELWRISIQPPLFPEGRRKCWLRRYLELLYLRYIDGCTCAEYTGMGIDKIGAQPLDYIRRGRDHDIKVVRPNKWSPVDWSAVLSDKYLFWLYSKVIGLKVVPVWGRYFKGGGFFWDDKRVDEGRFVNELKTKGRFFLKLEDLWCGIGCFRVKVVGDEFCGENGEKIDIEELCSKMDFIIQPIIEQHPLMSELNPSSVNTIRIVTGMRKDDGIVELVCLPIVRIGRRGSYVDNFAGGGFGVGLELDGRLKQMACSHTPSFEFYAFDRHPDWGYRFVDITIPMLSEVVDFAKKAHGYFPHLRTIGWDIAVTKDGPMIIEGNPGWDPMMMSIAHQMPMAKRVSRY